MSELDKLKKSITKQMGIASGFAVISEIERLETELAAAQQEIAELRKDKERLDWLIHKAVENDIFGIEITVEPTWPDDPDSGYWQVFTNNDDGAPVQLAFDRRSLRQAIDKATEGGNEQI